MGETPGQGQMMKLVNNLIFAANEVNFTTTATAGHFSDGAGPVPSNKSNGSLNPARRLPF